MASAGPAQPSVTYLLAGSFLFLVLGIAVTIGVPALDRPTPTETARPYTELELRGRQVYLREGCGYCHTQQVRAPEANRGTVLVPGDIGPESLPGDYAYQQPVFWGTNRQGPDLSHVATRRPSREWHIAHLKAPRAVVFGSVMPSYAHLPEDELEALAAYLLTLR